MSSKFKLEFDGLEHMIKKLEAKGANIEKAAEKALEATHAIVTPQIKAAMVPHNQNYYTSDSIVNNPKVEWEGNIASDGIGFSISNGGLASIFLMYGTPRMDPDRNLYNAIYGSATKKKVRDAQQEAFFKVLERT